MRIFDISSELGVCKVTAGMSLQQWIKKQKGGKNIYVTDDNIIRLYGDLFFESPTIVIGTGENKKNLTTIQQIFHRLLEYEADRTTLITGVGGGIVCDITGFAASTYMRGLPFNLMPTSLLAQVDASIGGKNGVNLNEFKNMIGTFSQPEQILLDFNVLKTLPRREICSGAAEIVKHALISSPALFRYLEKKSSELLALQPDIVEKLVLDSIAIKAAIVRKDAKEKGLRRILNFGHTFGHAIEKTYGLSHGESVSLGMVLAADVSVSQGFLAKEDRTRLLALLRRLELPTNFPMDKVRLLNAIRGDKKRQGDSLWFVLLSAFGKPLTAEVSFRELEDRINDLCELEENRA